MYIFSYDDLKPPSSPSPTQPGGEKPKKISDAVPTPTSSDTPTSVPEIDSFSETPSPSKGKESLSPYAVESAPPSTEEGNAVENNNPSQDSISWNSPYHV